MKYSVKFNGKQYEVEVEKIQEDFRAMSRAEVAGHVAGVAAPLPVTAPPAGAAASAGAAAPGVGAAPAGVAAPGVATAAAASAAGASMAASPVARPTPAPATASPRPPMAAPTAGVQAGAEVIKSPMPGKILEVKASAGMAVQAGQTVVVMEAMKMENEIVAPRDGVIDSIPVKAGDTVDTDAVLAILK